MQVLLGAWSRLQLGTIIFGKDVCLGLLANHASQKKNKAKMKIVEVILSFIVERIVKSKARTDIVPFALLANHANQKKNKANMKIVEVVLFVILERIVISKARETLYLSYFTALWLWRQGCWCVKFVFLHFSICMVVTPKILESWIFEIEKFYSSCTSSILL